MKRKTVLITDPRTREAREAAEYLRGEGYEVLFLPETVCPLDERAVADFGGGMIDDLLAVIVPAPPPVFKSISEATEEDFDRAADEGILTAFCLTKVFGNLFRDRGEGILIYLNSIHAEKPVGNGALFSMGCAAAQMLSREVNQDYGTRGVRSYFIQRGITATDPDGKSDLSNVYYGVDLRYPEHKMPEPGHLNGLIAFLLTPGAAPLAGSDLRADGGMTMYYGQRITMEEAMELRRKKMPIFGEVTTR